MPYCNVLDVWLSFPDLCDCMLETMGKSFLVGFEFHPGSYPLPFTFVILCHLADCQVMVAGLLTSDCQLSSMMRLVTVVNVLASIGLEVERAYYEHCASLKNPEQ
jgi:hypothetical protein